MPNLPFVERLLGLKGSWARKFWLFCSGYMYTKEKLFVAQLRFILINERQIKKKEKKFEIIDKMNNVIRKKIKRKLN